MAGLNHKDMNSNNKYVLLKDIITKGPISRIELSKTTGLSKMTVTAIVNEYIKKNIIWECSEAKSTGGRKRTNLDVSNDSLLTMGIYIGRDFLQVGIINLKGQILQTENISLKEIKSNEMLIDSIFMLSDKLIQSRYKDNIWGIGISCAGPLLVSDGIILNPPDFNNVHELNIVEILKDRYNLPVYLQNDMCVAALAEVYFGENREIDNFIYIGISSGIGGGVIINKKLFTGSSGLAGIIGHSIVEMNGIPCECGQRGCLEKYSSTRAVTKWVKEQGGGDLSWIELINEAAKEDKICLQAIERMADYLGVAICNMQSAYDTDCFIIGGDLNSYQDMVIDRLKDKMQKSSFFNERKNKVQLKPSTFMASASFIGTVALVMENNLTNY
ncbi:ROK family protein [Vallitalea guaymasensis]|uniref:ROK family protein n=1 Tax=Vallitalea guaymasensis TaxID=1185412 RepID=UPI00187D13C5|nr:ROK family protein [Vallitalea guaymasensis]